MARRAVEGVRGRLFGDAGIDGLPGLSFAIEQEQAFAAAAAFRPLSPEAMEAPDGPYVIPRTRMHRCEHG